jgi:hypothetical protein
MTPTRRTFALLSALSFAWATFLGPLADAIWYHADAESAAVMHVESADGPGCHAERCVVGAPVASVSPVSTSVDAPRFEVATRRVANLTPDDSHLDRLPPLPPGSRAPPA